MGLFDKIKEPVFLKENSDLVSQVEKLKSLKTDDTELQKQIDREIKFLEYGIYGESNIAFELKNSHIPMFVLHDIRLEHEGLSAQIDYIIVTRGKTFIVECKNLYGNIEIDNQGNFIRTINYGNKYKKEGIYSPITQNQRHLELLKKIISDKQTNIIQRTVFEKYFYDNYKSIVVLANPNTVLNAKFARKEVKNQVIRADQLISFIKKENENTSLVSMRSTEEFANSLLSLHREKESDYIEKYVLAVEKSAKSIKKDDNSIPQNPENSEEMICPKCGSKMIKRKATKGAYVGNDFWGCSNYPKCRFIINIKQ